MSRDIDIRVHEEVFGGNVVHRTYPCYLDPECGHWQAYHDPTVDVPDTHWHPVYVDEGGVWPPEKLADGELYARVEVVPFYSSSWADALDVIERMADLGAEFELRYLLGPGERHWEAFFQHVFFSVSDMQREPALAIAYAALICMQLIEKGYGKENP